ncbi:MAG: 3-hydroxyacyl-CoA dehydrogenase [Aquisalimonadaceae bacterium]
MRREYNSEALTIGVVGAGTMGRGIAQIAAQAGLRVCLYDARAEATQAALGAIEKVLVRLVDKGRMEQAAVAAILARIAPLGSLQGMADCDVVVEAIVEDLEAKRGLFRELEAICGEGTILASNTSSLSITAMAAACEYPHRVAGWHFFNPVPLMRVAEVIEGALTDRAVSDALLAITERMGHAGVRARDMPGFIINHANRGMTSEGLRVQSEGIADFATIDSIMRDAANFRMGPFQLLDLLGLDVAETVIESIYNQFYQEPRFRPTPLIRQRVAAGLYGRKSGHGFYDYRSGEPESPSAEPVAPAAVDRPIWISPAEPVGAAALAEALTAENVRLEQGEAPSNEAIIVVTPLGQDTSTACLEQGLDPARTVAVDTLFPLNGRRTLMGSPATGADYLQAAHGLLAAGGVPVSVVRDSPGFVAQRVVALIVTIACDIAQQRIAVPADIDTAVKRGLGYPQGPLEMGDALGAARILRVLENLERAYAEPRYRPSIWLSRRARLGLSLLQED